MFLITEQAQHIYNRSAAQHVVPAGSYHSWIEAFFIFISGARDAPNGITENDKILRSWDAFSMRKLAVSIAGDMDGLAMAFGIDQSHPHQLLD